MIGDEFTEVLRAAQQRDGQAFARLWRDSNPVLMRYVQVISTGDIARLARDTWAGIVRDMAGFRGDELAWRSWVLAAGRHRVGTDGSQRDTDSVRAAGSGPPGPPGASGADPDARPTEEALAGRELDLTLSELAALPLGQGEILMLRLCGRLPVETVAHLVGSDARTVGALEARGLARLGAEADLIAWSLDAPARPVELEGEEAAVALLLPRRVPTSGRHRRHRPATLVPVPRVALIGVTAASAVVLGGMSAAAYTGSLPDPVQNVLHRVIGVPRADHGEGSGNGSTGTTRGGQGRSVNRGSGSAVPGPLPTWGIAGQESRGTTTRPGAGSATGGRPGASGAGQGAPPATQGSEATTTAGTTGTGPKAKGKGGSADDAEGGSGESGSGKDGNGKNSNGKNASGSSDSGSGGTGTSATGASATGTPTGSAGSIEVSQPAGPKKKKAVPTVPPASLAPTPDPTSAPSGGTT